MVHRFFLHGSDLGLSFLWAVATNVSQLVTVVARHLGQSSLAHLLLSSVVPFAWFEGRFRCVINAQSFVFFPASAFYFSLVCVIVEDVFRICQACSSTVDVHGIGVALCGVCILLGCEGIVETRRYSLHLFPVVLEVDVFALSTNCRSFPLFVVSWAVQAHTVLVEVMGKTVSELS